MLEPATAAGRSQREVVDSDGVGCRAYEAVRAERGDFAAIELTPDMFLDHIPWRYCHAIDSLLAGRR